jgi:hypothetical protein
MRYILPKSLPWLNFSFLDNKNMIYNGFGTVKFLHYRLFLQINCKHKLSQLNNRYLQVLYHYFLL